LEGETLAEGMTLPAQNVSLAEVIQ
jgi:hypothetical protein